MEQLKGEIPWALRNKVSNLSFPKACMNLKVNIPPQSPSHPANPAKPLRPWIVPWQVVLLRGIAPSPALPVKQARLFLNTGAFLHLQ